MTDTITTADPEYGTDHQEGPDAPLGGTLEHLDPTSLVLEDNVRDEADLDKDFLDSIREHGVLTPVVAERGDDAIVRVRAGQRRTLAARAAGLATIPVYIRPATAADDRTQLTERIGQQIVENDKRRDLTDAQRARGIQQLLDAGVSVTKVAKSLAVPRDTVKAAATATSSAVAMDALAAGQLSLVEAAALTEFEDADEGTLQQLIDAAGGPQFEHTLAQLRQQRESAKALEDAAESYRTQGYRVLDEQPAWRDTSCVELRWLRTADGEAVTEDEITDPAHWAVWLDEEMGFVDRVTGERVDEDCIDFATEDDPNAEAEEGLRHFSTVLETTVFAPEWYCIDYEVSVKDAMDAVLGFTVLAEITKGGSPLRDPDQLGRTVATTVGPYIRTDLTEKDVDAGLAIEGRVNGKIRITGNTQNLRFGVAETVSYAARHRTLHPGDVISFGTPARPPELDAGDDIEVEIEGIGTLRTTLSECGAHRYDTCGVLP